MKEKLENLKEIIAKMNEEKAMSNESIMLEYYRRFHKSGGHKIQKVIKLNHFKH